MPARALQMRLQVALHMVLYEMTWPQARCAGKVACAGSVVCATCFARSVDQAGCGASRAAHTLRRIVTVAQFSLHRATF